MLAAQFSNRYTRLDLLKDGHDLAVGKRDFFIEIPQFRLRENSTYKHTGFSAGLPELLSL